MSQHESEPRSRAHADLGGGIHTLHQKGYVPKPNPQVPENERQASTTRGGIYEPSDNFAEESKKTYAENWRKMRQALAAKTVAELTFSNNPVEIQAVSEATTEQLALFED